MNGNIVAFPGRIPQIYEYRRLNPVQWVTGETHPTELPDYIMAFYDYHPESGTFYYREGQAA